MASKRDYRLNRHHKFQRAGRKYVADLETRNIIEVDDVEWDILGRYATQTQYQIVEELKEKYKVTSIFDGITRLEGFGERGQLLTRKYEAMTQLDAPADIDRKLKLLVPFDFTREESSLDYITNLNRYQLLASLVESAELETLAFSQVKETGAPVAAAENFKGVKIRQIAPEEGNGFTPAWYSKSGCDGLLLLSQFSTDNLLYYQVPDIPIIHCIESSQELQSSMLERLLHLHASQKSNDMLVVKASWMKQWLSEFGIQERHIHLIPDGINVVERIEKPLAKQHLAAIYDKPMFAQRPIVGLISGFEPNTGIQWITAFAQANPHLSIFVYDSALSRHCQDLPANVVIFGAEDQQMAAILPVFLQALDLVCFPAMPGTPISVVLEAIAYGTPALAMTKYGAPPEVEGTGSSIKSDWDNFGNFRVSMSELSAMINQWLKPSKMRAKSQEVAQSFAEKYTWQQTAGMMTQLFESNCLAQTRTHQVGEALFPTIFCRTYNPHMGTTTSSAYRLGVNRYEHLEKALAETLIKQHKPTEVESVFKHFNMRTAALNTDSLPRRN